MGILATVSSWVGRAISAAKPMLASAANFVSKTATVVNALMAGKDVLDRDEARRGQSRLGMSEHPNVINDDGDADKNQLAEIHSSIDDSRRKLESVSRDNELEHKRIQLQIDIMELVVSSSTFERFTNNINIHASNLQIHLQNIHNDSGMLDQLNRHRWALKALMGTVNHLINTTGQTGNVKKLEGIDIDIRPQSVSIKSSYEAFERTRTLLIEEVAQFSDSIDAQLKRIDNVRVAARKIPDSSKKVSDWLSNSVEPSLVSAREAAESLSGELKMVPRLEAEIRRNLEHIGEVAEEDI